MRIKPVISSACPLVLFLLAGSPAISQEQVGEVSDRTGKAWVIRENAFDGETLEQPIDKPEAVYYKDMLGAGEDSVLKISLFDGDSEITISAGSAHLAEWDKLTKVIKVRLENGILLYEHFGDVEGPCVGTSLAEIECLGTVVEVHAQAYESRVFVYEGKALVSSTDPGIMETQLLHAGEWVRSRKGEPIPPPQRFITGEVAAGPGSGSTQCIHSNCKITDEVLIPPPPVFTPPALAPPPPNPPGR